MKQSVRTGARAAASLLLAVTTLWTVGATAGAKSLGEAAESLSGGLPLALLRYERGELYTLHGLSPASALALSQQPMLLHAVTPPAEQPMEEPEPSAPEAGAAAEEERLPAPATLTVRDNGVPSTTLRPSDPAGYLVLDGVYVNNASSAALTAEELGGYEPVPAEEQPQVLIFHTHGCEAYTMPPGEEYVPSDDHRTLDETCSVLRVGDEIAQVLTEAGIGVLHDRTLHDYPGYSGAYNRSLATVEKYRAEYPSLRYVLDVHRDAIEDGSGGQYKLLCAERPEAAQLEFVIGSDGGGLEHPHWRENLRLACAVQRTLLRDYPTLLRPIIVRNSRYNQQVCPGALLLEVGAAGNSLEEALNAARLFARGFAETVR